MQTRSDAPLLTWEQTCPYAAKASPNNRPSGQQASSDHDLIYVNQPLSELRPDWSGHWSHVHRLFRTPGHDLQLALEVAIFSSAEMAATYLTDAVSQIPLLSKRRRFTTTETLGNDTFINGGNLPYWIRVRCNAALIRVGWRGPQVAQLAGVDPQWSGEALEAVAHLILYRVARHSEFTGVSARALRLTVNGRDLPDPVLELQDTVYVPLRPLAGLLNLPHAWEAKTGRLRLERPGQPAVDLQAGSFRAVPAAGPERTLSAPVLKEAEQPVLALADLLTLLGGQISQRENATLHVTL